MAMNDLEKMNRLAALASEGIPDDVDPAHDDAERDRFVTAVARGALRRRSGDGPLAVLQARPRWALAFAAAAALMLAGVTFWPAKRLGYVVESVPVAAGEVDGGVAAQPHLAEGGYLSAPAGSAARLRFTDGSSVALSPESSLRVTEVTSDGARILIEDGRASLQITPRPQARWSVEAGPFTVQVTGTVFDVAWSRSEGTLRVDLQQGSVVVRGPIATDGLPLRAGQRLIARLREGDVQIVAASAAGPTASGSMTPAGTPDAPAPTASAEDAQGGSQAREAPASSSAETAASAPPSWSRRVAAGAFQEVLAEAERRGLDAVLERGSLDDLVALGDAARYARRSDLAQRALSTTRKRFPGTSQGKAATFLLGRLLDSGGSPGAAIAWYDAYLGESPGGPFAAEALGRKMVAVERTGGRGAAKAIAERYLDLHPRGAHASFARDLLKP